MDMGEFSGNKPENGVHHFYTHCIDQKVAPLPGEPGKCSIVVWLERNYVSSILQEIFCTFVGCKPQPHTHQKNRITQNYINTKMNIYIHASIV